MDHPFFNPDSWMDVAAYFVIGLPALVAAVATWHGKQKSKERWAEHEASQKAVLNEVKNDHRTNLRDDIDALGETIRGGFGDIRKEIHWLREELRTERIERIEGDRRGGFSDYTTPRGS